MKGSIKKLYRKIFPGYEEELEKCVSDCKSLLDVGCGSDSPIKGFSKKLYCVGIDAFQPSIDKSKKKKIHDKYYKMGVLDIGKKFKKGEFDCVLASDLIEHLDKKDGLKLLKMMEKIAKKKIVIFTPNGFVEQGVYEDNPWQLHKSGWNVNEMKRKGYKVKGINGYKILRGEYAKVKFRPKVLWIIISDITQFVVKYYPSKAFQILCTKTKEKG